MNLYGWLYRFCLISFLFALFATAPATSYAEASEPTGPSINPDDVVLDPARQTVIWDAEHITFKLEKYFGRSFKDGWKQNDRDQIERLLLPDFEAQVLAATPDRTRSISTVEEFLYSAASRETGKETGDLSAAELFLDRLMNFRKRFTTVDSIGLRVLHIACSDETAGRWDTELLLYAGGRDKKDRLVEFKITSDVVFVFPNPEAITPNARIVRSWVQKSAIERAGQAVLMEEVTSAAGLDAIPLIDNWDLPPEDRREFRYQIAVEDFNKDGFLDIAMAGLDGRPFLLRSVDGEKFIDVAADLGLKAAKGSPREDYKHALVGWTDYNNDGWPDLFIGPRLFHNHEGKQFLEATARSNLYFDKVPLGVTTADFDSDGYLDLYFSYLKSTRPWKAKPMIPWVGDLESGGENMLWRNKGNGRFENVTHASMAGGGRQQTFASSAFYLNDDRFPDLYVANDFGTNVVLKNLGEGKFQDVTDQVEAGDYSTSMGVATGDLDNDGTTEIYIANMYSKMGRRIIDQVGYDDYPAGIYEQIRGSCAGNRLYSLEKEGGKYRELSESTGINEVGWAYAPAMVDLDGDGLLDLYATTGFMSYEKGKPDG